jgi:MFS family permease
MSGILQQGYSFGYVIAACANLGVGGSVNSWKTVFWIGAGVSIAVGLARIPFPESKQFLEAKAMGKNSKTHSVFWQETRHMLRQEWRLCIYCIILMTWVRTPDTDNVLPRLTLFSSTTIRILVRTPILHSCSPRST